MPRLDPTRREKLRIAIRYLVAKDMLGWGHQAQLADHFDVSRQFVHQVVNDEAQKMRKVRTKLKGAQETAATELG